MILHTPSFSFFFFNDTATTEIYTLSLTRRSSDLRVVERIYGLKPRASVLECGCPLPLCLGYSPGISKRCEKTKADRKSTRLNSSHGYISYAVFCLKKKKIETHKRPQIG